MNRRVPQVWLKQHSLNAINFYIYISLLAFFPPPSYIALSSLALLNNSASTILSFHYRIMLLSLNIRLYTWNENVAEKDRMHVYTTRVVSLVAKAIFDLRIYIHPLTYSNVSSWEWVSERERKRVERWRYRASFNKLDSSSKCKRSWHEQAEWTEESLCKKIH